jgi:multidrug efflux system membrane fusion protein
MTSRRIRGSSLAAVLLASSLLLSLSCAGVKGEEDHGPAARAGASEAVSGRPPGVWLTQEKVAHAALQVEVLKGVMKRGASICPGRVLSVMELAASRQSLARAAADEAAAKAQWQSAEAEAKRLRSLYENGANASEKAAEAAGAAAEQAKAQVNAAGAALRSERALAIQAWGPSLAGALESGGEPAASFLALRLVPVLVTPGGQSPAGPPPKECTVVSGGGSKPAQFVSRLPRTDGILQGEGWLYAAKPGASGLPAGLNVEVLLPTGPEAEGVEAPRSAGLWWQGALWVYVDRGANRYDRLLLDSPQPDEVGWFVTSPLKAGDRLVTGGAQVLLSEELKAHGVTGEADD